MEELRTGRSGRLLRLRRGGVAGAAVAALLALVACAGGSGAPVTVGPTASPEEPATYEPTLPPYTSDVELSADDEADVEELLLLIEQFSSYTSNVSDEHILGVNNLSKHLDAGLMSAYQDFVAEVENGEYVVTGTVSIEDSDLWRFDSRDYAMIGICYRYDHWGIVDQNGDNPDTTHDTESVVDTLAYVEAEMIDERWELYNQKFYSPEEGCSGLH